MDIRLDSTSLRVWVDDEGQDLVLVLSDGESRAILHGSGGTTELALRRLADQAMQLVALLGVRGGSPNPTAPSIFDPTAL